MPVPAVAAAAKAGSGAGHADALLNPKGAFMGNNKEAIILLMTASAVIIFVQHARSGQSQDGNQYVAIAVVGFFLLLLASFLPEIAFAFALLFTLGVVLNSPNGVPLLPKDAAKKG